jgi:hypothetical protein
MAVQYIRAETKSPSGFGLKRKKTTSHFLVLKKVLVFGSLNWHTCKLLQESEMCTAKTLYQKFEMKLRGLISGNT